MIGIPLVTLIYILVNVSYLTVLSPAAVVSSPAVAISWVSTLASDVLGEDYAFLDSYTPYMMTAFVATSTFGAANGSLFCAGRCVMRSHATYATGIYLA